METKHGSLNRSYVGTPMSPGLGSGGVDMNGTADDLEEVQRLQAMLQEQDTKWRTAYEKVVRENELLRNRGSETLLATQWRERYEACLKERDDLTEKVRVYMRQSDGTSGGKSIEQAYFDLKEEYKEFRKRFLAIQEQREAELDELRQRGVILRGGPGLSSGSNEVVTVTDGPLHQQSKLLYLKQMVFQYLSCRNLEVKTHMEKALIAMLRFNDLERGAIDEARKAEDVDTLTSITTFLGSFASG